MKRAAAVVCTALVLSGLAGDGWGADKYVIDPDHVSLNFSMEHSKWAKYQGTVRTITGTIVFDRDNLANSSVSVKIPTPSIDTLNKQRDVELLHAPGFLEADDNPVVTFESVSVEKTGEKTGRVVGNLTLAGKTKPVTLDVIFDGEDVSDWDQMHRVGFSATGALNTSDFGLTGLAGLDIGPELAFTIEVEATKP